MTYNEVFRRRVLKHAKLFLEKDATIRSVAKKTQWSKTTVELDLGARLQNIHNDLYDLVREKIEYHKEIRHLKGGDRTRQKWENKKKRAMGGM